jgi:DNA (cytosine-5)-methyltransferase 1
MIRFVDLFAGTGGIRLGFEQATNALGIETECIVSSDIDKRAQETYELNFGEKPVGDIRTIQDIAPFDMLLGGFPCQPFSYAGKQRGFVDTRGTLFFEVERLLKRYSPKAFLLENVRGLTTHDEGRTFQTILEHLKELGYGVKYLVLNSSSFGVPQNRVRVYILGLKGHEPILNLQSDFGSSDSHKFKESMSQGKLFAPFGRKVVKDILEDKVDEKYYCSPGFSEALYKHVNGDISKLHGVRLIDYRNGQSIHSWELGLKGKCTKIEIDFMNALIANRRKKKFGTHQDGKRLTKKQIESFFDHPKLGEIISSLERKGYIKAIDGKYNPVAGNMSFEVFKFLDPESISITLVSSDAERLGVAHKGKLRRITPREAARIQGYPDTYQPHPNDRVAYHQFGNAVAVPVVKEVMSDFLISNSSYFGKQLVDLKPRSNQSILS